jgi:hypothetical protein
MRLLLLLLLLVAVQLACVQCVFSRYLDCGQD